MAGNWYVDAVSGQDSNDCRTPATACKTISTAISKAADGQTIAIAAGTYVENITLDRSLSLIGAGATTTIIDGSAVGRTIMINTGISASISGLTIRNGKVGGSGGSFGGAGIYSSGTLSMSNSIVRDNTAGSFAGGIYNDRGRTMILTNVQVLNNKATPLDSVIGNRNGGGIVNSGSLTITNSLISGNSADLGTLVDSDPNNPITDSVGGGIFNDGNSQLTLVRTSVVSNTTTTAPGGRSAEGAGIQNYGAATLIDSHIRGNTASGRNADGGGAYNVRGTLTLIRSTVSDNTATGDNSAGTVVHGGGINNEGLLTLIDSTVSGNIARDGAAYVRGGGIASFNGITSTLILTNSKVLGNTLSGLGEAWGGGIMASGTITLSGQSSVDNNHVTSTAGGGGGGIFGYYDSTLHITNSSVTTNTISGVSLVDGGGIVILSGRLNMNNSTVSGNRADAAGDPNSTAVGGGMDINQGSFTIADSYIENNHATTASGGLSNGGTISITNSIIGRNSAVRAGGMGNQGTAILSDTQIISNTATESGGIQNNGTLTLNSSIVNGNTASNGSGRSYGGGIENNDTLTITLSLLTNNTTDSSTDSLGGGVYSCATLTIDRSIIERNRTTGIGGGAGLYECGHSDIVNSTFSENTADSGGGALANAGFMTLTNSTISGNRVIGSSGNGTGGGIANASGDLAIRNSTIVSNTAPFGGGIAYTNRSLTLANTIVAGNHATNGPDCIGALTSLGNNLFGITNAPAQCNAIASDILTDTAHLRLGLLQNNGGPTPTHALRPGSPALDAGDDAICPRADQRGVTRPQGAHCDIGAYEGGATAARLAFSAQPGQAQLGQPLSVQPVLVVVDDQGNGAGFNGLVTLSLIGGTPGARLSATSSSAVNGRATFTNLSIDRPGVGYRLVATAAGLSTATSGAFDILTLPLPPNTDPPSEVEVNDTLPAANQLLFDIQEHSARTGLISATVALTADIDLYRFDVAPKSQVRIRLTGLHAGPNNLPANYDMLLLPAIGAESDEGTLDLGKIADVARNFIARNFIARNFIARNFIARNFIGDTLGALSDNSGLQDEQIDTFVQNGGTYYLIVYGADEQQASPTNRYRLDVERHIGELPLPPNAAHPISGLLSGGVSAQPDPQVRTIYIYNSNRIAKPYNQNQDELNARDKLTHLLTSNDLLKADADTGKGKGVAIDLSTALLSTDHNTMSGLYDNWDDELREHPNNPADEPVVPPRANPLYANEVAQQIKYVLDYALTRLYTGTTDIVLVGGDSVIPFYRVPDETTFANESDYPYQLQNTGLLPDTALIGGMTHSFMQTDNFYATRKPIFWRNRGLYVPDLGIGRLVERPSEIMHYLQSYLDSPSDERFTIDARFATPPNAGAAFVTGYGFLSDQAQELAAKLGAYGLTNNYTSTATLGTTYTLNLLNNNNWDLNRFSDLWLSGQLPRLTATAPYTGTQTRYDLSALNSHFSHYGADPAIGDTAIFSAEQLLNLTPELDVNAFFKKDGRPTLIYSIGCHSGLSATDQAFSTPFYQADFPQAVLKQGGNWIGNTGYAYGDSDLIAYSERLSVLFTRAIGRTITETDTLGKDKYLGAPIGESLARAKWDYLPKGAGSFSVYDEKVVEQMTLYGLPFIRVKVPKPTPAPLPPPAPQVWESKIDSTGILTRLITIDNAFSRVLTPSVDTIPQVSSSVHDDFQSDTTAAIQIEDRVVNGQPVLPILRYDITLPPSNAGFGMPIPRAVRLKDATSTDVVDYNPHVATTITDTLAKPPSEPRLSPRKTWLPAVPYTFLQTVQHPGATNVITTDNLLVIPAQFNARTSKIGTLRQYSHMVFEVTYVVPGYSAAIPQLGPRMSRAQIIAPNRQGIARLRATVLAGQVEAPLQVSAIYTTNGITWQHADLALVPRHKGRYEMSIPAARGTAIYAFFEARDRTGNTTALSAQR